MTTTPSAAAKKKATFNTLTVSEVRALTEDSVEIENGVNTIAYVGDSAFAAMVDATLGDPRGWTSTGDFEFIVVEGNQLCFPIHCLLRNKVQNVEETVEVGVSAKL